MLLLVKEARKGRRISELFKTKRSEVSNKKEKRKIKFAYLKALRTRVDYCYLFSTNKKQGELVYSGILALEAILLVAFVFMNQFLLAILLPLMVHFFALKALEMATDTIHVYVQKELPIAIKHLIKALTKSSDLKTVMTETSSNLREPLRSKFFELSRRMITENHEKCLMEFADELDDTWIYAFVFLLLSYKEQSKKTDIIKNLANLADMIETENFQREKAITEKKSVVILNYALGAVGTAGLLLNLTVNADSRQFFFHSLGGLVCFVIGCSAIMGTVLINLLLQKKTF